MFSIVLRGDREGLSGRGFGVRRRSVTRLVSLRNDSEIDLLFSIPRGLEGGSCVPFSKVVKV